MQVEDEKIKEIMKKAEKRRYELYHSDFGDFSVLEDPKNLKQIKECFLKKNKKKREYKTGILKKIRCFFKNSKNRIENRGKV